MKIMFLVSLGALAGRIILTRKVRIILPLRVAGIIKNIILKKFNKK